MIFYKNVFRGFQLRKEAMHCNLYVSTNTSMLTLRKNSEFTFYLDKNYGKYILNTI